MLLNKLLYLMKKVLAVLAPLILLIQCHPDKSVPIDLDYQPHKPEIFAPGYISTNLYERDIAISSDGHEIIYTLSDYKQSRRCLVMIKKNGNKWGKKEILSFSGQYSDIEPFFSVDGNKLYFASNRPVNDDTSRTDYNIWVSERNNQGWGEPKCLPPDINTIQDEFFPSLGKNNNLYFTSARENGPGKEDIYLSRYADGKYLEPVPLDTNVNSTTYEFNAYINPEENRIIFSSYGRKDDLGGGDLYFSKKDQNGNWLPAVHLGSPINSDKLDYCPFLDIPRGNFYFTSDRNETLPARIENVSEIDHLANGILNGMGNIYRIRLDQLKLN
jgi:hypothetical protein